MADSLGLATSQQAKTGYGFSFFIGTGDDLNTATWQKIEGMKSGALPSPNKPEIDVTTTDDEVKASIPGTGSIDNISLEFNFYPHNSVHQMLVAEVLYTEEDRPWKIVGQGMEVKFFGYMVSASTSFGVDAALSMPLTLKVTTKPEISFEAVGGTITYDSTLAGEDSDGTVTGSVVGTLAPASGVAATFSTEVTTDFVRNRDYTIMNVPVGLTPKLTKTSATVATLTFTGEATNTADVSNIVLEFTDSAFSGVKANQINGYVKPGISITFV